MKKLKLLLFVLLVLPLAFAACSDKDERKEIIFYEVGDLYQEKDKL